MASSTPAAPTPGPGGSGVDGSLAAVTSAARERLSSVVAETDAAPVETPAAPAPQPEAVPAPAPQPAAPAPAVTPAAPAPPPPVAAPPLPVVTAAPAAAPAAPAEPPPTPAQLEERFGVELKTLIDSDREATGWVEEWSRNGERLGALGPDLGQGGKGEIAVLERKLISAEDYLARPEVQADDYLKGTAEQQLRDLRSDLRIVRLERQELSARNRELDQNYTDRYAQHSDRVEQRLASAQQQIDREARITQESEKFREAWTPALQRVIQAKGIPANLAKGFEERSKHAVIYQIDSQDGKPIQSLDEFLGRQADTFIQEMTDFHREKSAEYARIAAERAGQPAPSPAGAPPAAVETLKSPTSLEDVYKGRRTFLQRLRSGVA